MKLFVLKAKIFYLIVVGIFLISLTNSSYAQIQSDIGPQFTLSNDLQNDPAAQDILKKIEQTRKMIKELNEKEFEKNQAQENLEKMRDMSIERLNQDLNEWERLWEKHSPRNAFAKFVSKKPSYIQGVFWDQFEFKEQKVNAGRIAMNQSLLSGGTMQDARDAYIKAASTKKIELIEINAQANVRHNLANFEEQQVFNSTGQVHSSPAIQMKLANFYTDYKLQPSFILANSDTRDVSKLSSEVNSKTICEHGYVLVSRVTTGSQACIEEQTAKKWINNSIKEIIILDGKNFDSDSYISNVKTNPATKCEEGYQVIYHITALEYQCVLESIGMEMINNNTAETHTLIEYILNKDKQKIYEDVIFEINQNIQNVKEEYNIKKKILSSEYDGKLESENSLQKQKIQEIIKEYQTSNEITENLSKGISEARDVNISNKEKIQQEKLDAINKLELELKNEILEIVKGYEGNSDINVDWQYL